MTGARYETCRECGLEWNISKQTTIPWCGYLCPRCRAKYKQPRRIENRKEQTHEK